MREKERLCRDESRRRCASNEGTNHEDTRGAISASARSVTRGGESRSRESRESGERLVLLVVRVGNEHAGASVLSIAVSIEVFVSRSIFRRLRRDKRLFSAFSSFSLSGSSCIEREREGGERAISSIVRVRPFSLVFAMPRRFYDEQG